MQAQRSLWLSLPILQSADNQTTNDTQTAEPASAENICALDDLRQRIACEAGTVIHPGRGYECR